MSIILVHMSEPHWTLQAIHFACALSRNIGADVILLRLIQVNHPGYLGTEYGDRLLTMREERLLAEYAATAEDYGVALTYCQMQCATALNALADAADHVDADMVFAHIPPSRIPLWRDLQIWTLWRRLAGSGRQLFTLDKPLPTSEQLPTITARPAHVVAGRR